MKHLRLSAVLGISKKQAYFLGQPVRRHGTCPIEAISAVDGYVLIWAVAPEGLGSVYNAINGRLLRKGFRYKLHTSKQLELSETFVSFPLPL